MKHPLERDWMIVAPWWQWSDPASIPPDQPVDPDPAKGRLTTPVFQKYDSSQLVGDFLKDPQRCLAFGDDDLVHVVQPRPSSEPVKNSSDKLLRLTAFEGPTTTEITNDEWVIDEPNTRKIFLDTHKRHYLVVCDVRCDGPGFPKVARDKICKAGFVVRRRTATASSACQNEMKPVLQQMAQTKTRILRVSQLSEIETRARSEVTGKEFLSSARLTSLLSKRKSLQALLDSDRDRFLGLVEKFGVSAHLQGWFPSPSGLSKVGCWRDVEDTPADPGDEVSYPLYPLIPDTNDPEHDGQFGTIYFGVLPTSSHDCDERGVARFDDREYYEVRCWVLRHKVAHDPDQPCPCPDGIFWSRPTDNYRLAPHFDLTGTSHHPVTVQCPDLKALAAQAKPALGVAFSKPPGTPMFKGGQTIPTTGTLSEGTEICFFPIPLITIVALFVFHIFLPIVMYIFNLWWMLALKFCIAPEIDFGVALTSALSDQGMLGVDGQIAISADMDIQDVEDTITDAFTSIGTDMRTELSKTYDSGAVDKLMGLYSPIAIVNMALSTTAASQALDDDANNDPAEGVTTPSAAGDSQYVPEVTHA